MNNQFDNIRMTEKKLWNFFNFNEFLQFGRVTIVPMYLLRLLYTMVN